MAQTTKRAIRFMAPVEEVSAKFARVIDTSSKTSITGKQNHRWFGAAMRSYSRQGMGVVGKQIFVYRKFPRQSTPGQTELDNRNIFKFASTWTAATMDNLSLVTQIQADYRDGKRLQNISPAGYTLRGWVFAVRWEQKNNNPTYTPSSPEYSQWPTA